MSKLDIVTAINLTRKYERTQRCLSHQKIMEETTTLRFKVGDRVACKLRGEGFQPGTVIKLWYTEKYFPEGCLQSLVPYQVRLDNDDLIYAEKDEDRCIKISNSPHICGNCGNKEQSNNDDNNLKACTSCKTVKYEVVP